jgi:1,4-alpha-glucan branching enzyme
MNLTIQPAERSLAKSLQDGQCTDPFALLGAHATDIAGVYRVRVFAPGCTAVHALARGSGAWRVRLNQVPESALFVGDLTLPSPADYQLQMDAELGSRIIEDPYRFGPWLGDTDVWLLAQGNHLRPWEKLGAHLCTQEGVEGVAFAVWAPNARQVSLAGDFNWWNNSCHPMRFRAECGVWEIFLPGIRAGALYKYDVLGADGQRTLKADPYALSGELPPGLASRVMALPAPVLGREAMRLQGNARNAPISIYEVHAGSWRRPQGQLPDWQFLAEHLVPYVVDMGFTHLELLPIHEHPFYASWGYQPTGLYAPTARYGSPQSFLAFVEAVHAAGLQLILDWVPGHFPTDGHALARFDGTAQYEHADPREGFHRDWNTLIYNWGRHEVRNFLVGNALFWIERYGIDGLRVDAVASMLYRDYSRLPGEWIPNRDGGRENMEAIEFLRATNRVIGQQAPGTVTMAEESTAFPGVSAPPWVGGLGFNYKWNMGWMHDTLAYFEIDPVLRQYHHDRISFAMVYAYSEHFVLPLSHDEVVHGKGSLYARMWGDAWQKCANLKSLFALMYAHPGRKLLFMGSELGQKHEWNHDAELDWPVLEDASHAGVQSLVRDLNHLYRSRAALHERDDEHGGFSWIEVNDRLNSVFGFLRCGHLAEQQMLVVGNFTPVVRQGYRLGVPKAGVWRECLNTDSQHYAGSGVGNFGQVMSEAVPSHGYADSICLTLPPLGVIWLEPQA